MEKSDAQNFQFKRGEIEFRDVSFGHNRSLSKDASLSEQASQSEPSKDENINYLFENFNLKIEAGSTNAIVGPSGFGKTSMLHLLFRIYDP